jgi:hypothetical protein
VSSGAALLERVRVGHHPELEPPELHVVLDLATDDVEATAVEVGQGRMEVRLLAPTRAPSDAIAGRALGVSGAAGGGADAAPR